MDGFNERLSEAGSGIALPAKLPFSNMGQCLLLLYCPANNQNQIL
jgi:hypothetical protein